MEPKLHTGGNKNIFQITKGRNKCFKDVTRVENKPYGDALKFALTNILTGLSYLFLLHSDLLSVHIVRFSGKESYTQMKLITVGRSYY